MSESQHEAPYISLGRHLKYVREQARQSLAEVSGAIEIDEETLACIEAGTERPDEDVLMLLISYFKVADREAVQLWELADYGGEIPEEIRTGEPINTKQPIMLLAMDVRTLYSDGVDIMANNSGLTLNFIQAVNPKTSIPVARVGMSIDQAREVAKGIERAIIKLKYSSRELPPPSQV